MEDRSIHDELHALASGTLSPEEVRRIRERCEAEPELAALLEESLEVHALTQPGDVEPPPCRLSFETLMGTLVPQRAGRMVLHRTWRVAAAVLVLAVGGFLLSRAFTDRSDRSAGGEAGRPLHLAAIPLVQEAALESEFPESLADYRPVKDAAIQWVASLSEAKVMARASSRPVLLFLHHPTCPACLSIQRDTFTHPEVLALANRFVPVLVDIREADLETRRLASGNPWPWLGAVDAEGALILSFPGVRGPGDFAGRLTEAIRLAGPPALTWDRVNGLAKRLGKAARAEEDGALTAALEVYEALAQEMGGTVFGQASLQGRARIGAQARTALLGARILARSSGPELALRALGEEIERFAGTPYAADFRMVRDHLREHGAFPALAGLLETGTEED